MPISPRPCSTTSGKSASASRCGRSSGRPSSRPGATRSTRTSSRAASGAFGNAATRLAAFVVGGGTYAYGSYPDIDALFNEQAVELDNKRRTEIVEKIQQMVYERTLIAPIWQLGFINGVGPRVGESGFGLITDFAYTAPFEDITLKAT